MHHAGRSGGFPRWWTELVATIADHVPGGITGLAVIVLLLAGAVIAALYWWPARRRPPATRKPAMASPPVQSDAEQPDELPDRPAEVWRSMADRYAAEGRFAEAVRERLRAMVRSLVECGVIDNRPGWTVTELASAAGVAQPATAGPLGEATRVFSDIWYGQRAASAAHDARMRELADRLDHLASAGEVRS